jgi:hypothetical protein
VERRKPLDASIPVVYRWEEGVGGEGKDTPVRESAGRSVNELRSGPKLGHGQN